MNISTLLNAGLPQDHCACALISDVLPESLSAERVNYLKEKLKLSWM